MRDQPVPHLTSREREVLGGVKRGLDNKGIATELGIATQSVKEYVSVLLEKFGVGNRTRLAEAARDIDLVGQPSAPSRWLRVLFTDAPLGIAMLRGPELRFELANETFRKLLGNRELIGRSLPEVVPGVDMMRWVARLAHVYATGEPVLRHEFPLTWDNGNGPHEGFVNALVEPLYTDAGHVDGVAIFVMDVSAEVRARRPVIDAQSFE